MNTKRPKEAELQLDREVAARIRVLRRARGLTQTELGRRIGVTFQQIQKYENGTNRLTAGRLIILSEILGVPVGQFFTSSAAAQQPHTAPAPDLEGRARPLHREVLELARNFARIEDPRTRKHIVALTRHLGSALEDCAEDHAEEHTEDCAEDAQTAAA